MGNVVCDSNVCQEWISCTVKSSTLYCLIGTNRNLRKDWIAITFTPSDLLPLRLYLSQNYLRGIHSLMWDYCRVRYRPPPPVSAKFTSIYRLANVGLPFVIYIPPSVKRYRPIRITFLNYETIEHSTGIYTNSCHNMVAIVSPNTIET